MAARSVVIRTVVVGGPFHGAITGLPQGTKIGQVINLERSFDDADMKSVYYHAQLHGQPVLVHIGMQAPDAQAMVRINADGSIDPVVPS